MEKVDAQTHGTLNEECTMPIVKYQHNIKKVSQLTDTWYRIGMNLLQIYFPFSIKKDLIFQQAFLCI